MACSSPLGLITIIFIEVLMCGKVSLHSLPETCDLSSERSPRAYAVHRFVPVRTVPLNRTKVVLGASLEEWPWIVLEAREETCSPLQLDGSSTSSATQESTLYQGMDTVLTPCSSPGC